MRVVDTTVRQLMKEVVGNGFDRLDSAVSLADAVGYKITDPLTRIGFVVQAVQDILQFLPHWEGLSSYCDSLNEDIRDEYSPCGPREVWGSAVQRAEWADEDSPRI